MDAATASSDRYERWVWIGGLAVFGLVFAVALGGSFVASLAAPSVAWVIPVSILAAGTVAVLLPRTPYTTLALYIGLFTTVSGPSEGVRPHEVLFVLVHVLFTTWWFWTRVVVWRQRVLRGVGDTALFAFVVYVIGSLGLTVLFGGNLFVGLNEAVMLSLFAAYFPLREAFERAADDGDTALTMVVVAVVFWFGLVGAFRVVTSVYSALSDAEYAWQIARGRVPLNEVFVYSASLLALALASVARTPLRLALLSLGFAVFTVALIMTQWRSYYVAWALAVGLILLLIGHAGRLRGGLLLGASTVIGGGLAMLVFGDVVTLALIGIADRILSIGTATTQEVSLTNRYLEAYAIWDRIQESPLLGHGTGVEFSFFDTIFNATWTKTFAHNTYLMLWFKFGFFGLALFLLAWGGAIVSGLRACLSSEPQVRALGVFVVSALAAFSVSSLVSGAFATDDVIFSFAILLAIGGALKTRASPAALKHG